MSTTEYLLSDIDNRDGDGAPYEFHGEAEKVIGYLDGPLRHDTLPGSVWKVDVAIGMVREGRFKEAHEVLHHLGIDLHLVREKKIGWDCWFDGCTRTAENGPLLRITPPGQPGNFMCRKHADASYT